MYEPPDLLVSEIFGPTLQGEGRSVGRQCAFVRLGGCNLACKWCDTPYTWAFDKRHAEMHESRHQYNPLEEMRRMRPKEVAEEVKKHVNSKYDLIVISGGEPMLQQEGIAALIHELSGHDFEIETAGTRMVEAPLLSVNDWPMAEPFVRYNVSPKLFHSGNPLGKRRVWPALKQLAQQPSTFKFVVNPETWEEDSEEIREIVAGIDLQWLERRIWIMPIGTTDWEQLANMRKLADKVLEAGWNLTPRLHTLVWGMERGR